MRFYILSLLILLLSISVVAQEQSDTSLVVNEVQVANIDQYLDKANCYGGWIEIYNPSSTAQSLKGMYVSDGVHEMHLLSTHGSVPAKGFKVIWFDHYYNTGSYGTYSRLQMNYKLDYEGGIISLLASDHSVISSVSYPPAFPRCSWARIQDGGEEWGTTCEPTPEATNTTSRFASERLAAPVVDTDSRVFREVFTVRVEIPSGAYLRYTTDGSAPTASNGRTSSDGRFTIEETTILRLCLMKNGYLSSPVVTRSYIFQNHDYYLPILVVSSEPKNFFDDKVGIFVKGTNGISGNGQSEACNWNMDWERPVNMNYMVPVKDEDGNLHYSEVLNQEADIEIAGGWSRAYGAGTVDGKYWQTRSSFRIKTDKKYEGANVIDYPVFPSKKFNKYRSWQVRNGGNDTYARTKDPAIQMIVMKSGFYVDCQDYQPAHVFLNGDYYGMLNIRESNNKHFAYSNYGIDFDDMDQFDLSNAQYNQKVGDNKAWNQLQRLASNLAQTKNVGTYKQICALLDMDEYINYMALECYMGPTDWITNTNNVKGFRSRTDGKFHFVLFDTDSAFGTESMLTKVLNTSDGANVDDLFRYLMKYDPFRRQFMDAYCIVNGSVFEPTRCEEIIEDIYDNINPALRFEGGRSSMKLASTISSAYNGGRITTLRNYLSLKYSLNASISADISEARLTINGQEIPTGKFAGYLFSYGTGEPINISATAPAGYKFAEWQVENLITGETFSFTDAETIDLHAKFNNNDNVKLTARFEAIPDGQERWEAGCTPLRINEVSSGNDIYISDYGKKSDWLELYNTTNQDIELAGLYLSNNRDNPQKYQFQGGVVPAHGTCVVWCDGKDDITQLHAPFKLDNADGACVSIMANDGSWLDCLEYVKQNKWQTYGRYPDGGNMTALLNQPTINKTNKIGMADYFDAVDEVQPVIASSSSSRIRAVEYYNLQGQRLFNSKFKVQNSKFSTSHGIIIRKEIYEDGSIKVSKSL